jgi:hypothetical protein
MLIKNETITKGTSSVFCTYIYAPAMRTIRAVVCVEPSSSMHTSAMEDKVTWSDSAARWHLHQRHVCLRKCMVGVPMYALCLYCIACTESCMPPCDYLLTSDSADHTASSMCSCPWLNDGTDSTYTGACRYSLRAWHMVDGVLVKDNQFDGSNRSSLLRRSSGPGVP